MSYSQGSLVQDGCMTPSLVSTRKLSLSSPRRKGSQMLVMKQGGMVCWQLNMSIGEIPVDVRRLVGNKPFADRVFSVLSGFQSGAIPRGSVKKGDLEVVRILSATFGPSGKWEAWDMVVRGPANNSVGYVEFPYFWLGPREVCVAVLLPLMADGKVVLVRQYRHQLRRETWEAPRGGCKGEILELGALREGAEEAGVFRTSNSQLLSLGTYVPESGCLAYEGELFLCTDMELRDRVVEDGEAIMEVRAFSTREVADMATRWHLDGYTEAAFSRALYRKLISL